MFGFNFTDLRHPLLVLILFYRYQIAALVFSREKILSRNYIRSLVLNVSDFFFFPQEGKKQNNAS